MITIPRNNYEKGSLVKPLKSQKVAWLKNNWWECEKASNVPSGCDPIAIVTLQPSEQVEDSIVDSYFQLLERRERNLFDHEGCGAVKYYFMSPWFFQVMASYHCKNMKKNPLKRKSNEWDAIDNDFRSYGTIERGSKKITDFDYILMPVATDNHWILFLWSIKDFRVSLFDPLRDDTPFMSLKDLYKKQFFIVVNFMSFLYFI